MFDEVIRLRKCRSRRERKEIRAFLISAYWLCTKQGLGNLACRITSLEKKMKMVKESYNSTGKKLNF
jgi:hypothetical protein